MLGTKCAACGAPTPIALGDDVVCCVHCGTHSPLPPSVHAGIHAARQLLGALDVRHRQLTETEQRALTWEGRLRGCFVVVFGGVTALMIAFIALFVLGVFVGEGGFTIFTATWLLLPFVAMLVGFVLLARGYLRRLTRARESLERACAAVPPRHPGEAAGCHVCGGPLEGYGSAPVARCVYCSADNLVAPEVLARTTRDEALVLDGFEAAVKGEASIGSRSAAKGILLLPFFLVASVAGVCCLWGGAVYAAVQIEGEVVDADTLVWVDVPPHGRCIMHVARERTPSPMAYWSYVPHARYPIPAPRARVDLRALEGQPILHLGNDLVVPERVVFERAYTTPAFPGDIYVRARHADGNVLRFTVLGGVCLVAP